MKRVIISLAAAMSAFATEAANYPYLSFQKADGTILSVGVEALEMSFSDGKLIVSNSSGNYELNTADLKRMFFADNSETSINDTPAVQDNSLQVYSTSGIYMGMYNNQQDFIQKSSKGVYIVKQNGKTFKMTVK